MLAFFRLEHFRLGFVFPAPSGMFRHAVEITGPAAARRFDGRLSPLDLPVTLRLDERRIDDRRFNLRRGDRRRRLLAAAVAITSPLRRFSPPSVRCPRSSMTLTAIRRLSPSDERLADRSGQMFPNALAEIAIERLLQIVPCPGFREEHLRGAEHHPVVIGVQHPARQVFGLDGVRLHRVGPENVEALDLDLISGFRPALPAGSSVTSGRPVIEKISLDRLVFKRSDITMSGVTAI